MDTKITPSKSRWETADRLFWISIISSFLSLFVVIVSVFLWWPLSWDWDSDKLSIAAYIDIAVGVVGLVVGALSVVVMVVSFIVVLISRE